MTPYESMQIHRRRKSQVVILAFAAAILAIALWVLP